MNTQARRCSYSFIFAVMITVVTPIPVAAQDTVTGAFEGVVTSSLTGEPVAGATAVIINGQTNLTITKRADARGRFYQGLLAPGIYTIRVSADGFQTQEVVQQLRITRTGEVVPVPVTLDPLPTPTAQPSVTPSTTPATGTTPTALSVEDTDVRAQVNATDARRDGSFTETEVVGLPLGATTFVRTFDELALLLPGVAPPPPTIGGGSGPGVGAGVGSAGQFAVNGLRSRANNFTVDGSDNNDEDIGVRRQGFVALNSQPIESVREFQVITLLAPAQFGRNLGAQINAVSKSGGSETHGTLYGFFNSNQLNARNSFDSLGTNGTTPLTSRSGQPVLLGGNPLTTRNESGAEDSLTFGQAGFVLGGTVKRDRVFYFLSAEGQLINANQERNFAVPTIEQRGIFDTGASGLFTSPVAGVATNNIFAYPTTAGGDGIFSLYPFPNNPSGIYGVNTLTRLLPASGKGAVLSAKIDYNFNRAGRAQSLTGRYNFTNDARTIPVTGGALFSSLRPRVRTQNLSLFFNSEISAPDSEIAVFNQVRVSYGRTRLVFNEVRDSQFQIPSRRLPGSPFLLNAPLLLNDTLPASQNGGTRFVPNTGAVRYIIDPFVPVTEDVLGPVGQVRVAGFSPIGVDVFNFPQRRINNTYQLADTLTLRSGTHSFAFGVDTRRTELNSMLPRNSRPLISFGGAPQLAGSFDETTGLFGNLNFTGAFFRPETFVAASAASGFTQTLARGGESGINLRYYQLNFFAQDTWRIRRNLSLSYGVRYEYNTPPREVNRRIEDTFDDASLNLIPGLRNFIGERSRIFETERANFAPRVGLVYAPNVFGADRLTILRAGYGLFYDQILGAVVSQSRNVYPTYLTINLAGGFANLRYLRGCAENQTFASPGCPLEFTNPQLATLFGAPIVQTGTLNTLNSNLSFGQLVNLINAFGTGGGTFPAVSGFGATIPTERLATPLAHHYTFGIEQQLSRDSTLSVAYVGTLGRNLLRFTTPNLGENSFIVPLEFTPVQGDLFQRVPQLFGLALPPGTRIAPSRDRFIGGRPASGVGAINRFETTARSRYDSLQVSLRGRLNRSLQYGASYTFSKALDDVSDIFDLAGASVLPQNSLAPDERGLANFDAPHRFTYNFVYDFTTDRSGIARLLNGLQIAATGRMQTGQPFTVNSIYDVNLDGNLTDRLNSTNGIVATGDGRQPLRLTVNPISLLAPVGEDGSVGRNTFRAGSIVELDASITKRFTLREGHDVMLRVDIFNFINQVNYGIPVRFLEAPGFGQAADTITPGRRIQFALKYSF
ncbi:MAG: carboxypeptidase-like regulatory domain-containing protein [Pyrinomonadaceae bacterium MAG19_C2-C3]|nr:carboxypeptidase-like regulatory domain-containing protein [Pyrinomonadaceae bacterium MAG19_C2-C3]